MPVVASPAAAEVPASNIGRPATQTPNVAFVDSTDRQARGFTTTGSNPAGYSVESIEVEYRTPGDFLNTGKEQAK